MLMIILMAVLFVPVAYADWKRGVKFWQRLR